MAKRYPTIKLMRRFSVLWVKMSKNYASHERSNWAMGLGLPMLLVDPSLGSYAPLTREVLLQSRVCHLIRSRRDAVESSAVIGRLQRAGELVRMAQMGWGRFDIQGFRCIADALAVGSL